MTTTAYRYQHIECGCGPYQPHASCGDPHRPTDAFTFWHTCAGFDAGIEDWFTSGLHFHAVTEVSLYLTLATDLLPRAYAAGWEIRRLTIDDDDRCRTSPTGQIVYDPDAVTASEHVGLEELQQICNENDPHPQYTTVTMTKESNTRRPTW